jgi:hypothetical protein
MGKVILKTDIIRQKNMLYYCSTNKADGTITVCEAVMARGRKKGK